MGFLRLDSLKTWIYGLSILIIYVLVISIYNHEMCNRKMDKIETQNDNFIYSQTQHSPYGSQNKGAESHFKLSENLLRELKNDNVQIRDTQTTNRRGVRFNFTDMQSRNLLRSLRILKKHILISRRWENHYVDVNQSLHQMFMSFFLLFYYYIFKKYLRYSSTATL